MKEKMLSKNNLSSIMNAFFSNSLIPNIFEKIYLSKTPEEAFHHLLEILRKNLNTNDVYIYNKHQDIHFHNRKLRYFFNQKLLSKIMKLIEKKAFLDLFQEFKRREISIPKRIKSIFACKLKKEKTSIGMLLIINSPCDQETITTFTQYANFFYPLIYQKQKQSKYERISRIKFLKFPFLYGEFLIESKIKFLHGDDRIAKIFANAPPLFSIFDYQEVRFLIKLKDRLYYCEDVAFPLSIKENNERLWFNVYGTCVAKYKGNPIYCFIFIDMTKEKILEKDLKETEIKFNFITKNLEVNFFEYDLINDIFYSYGIYPQGQEIIYNYLENYKQKHPHLSNEQAKWVALLSGQEIKNFAFEITKQGNQVFWYEVESEKIFISGKQVKVIGKFNDITAAKEAEAAILRESRTDKITQIYNRTCGEYLIRKYLTEKKEEEIDSLLIIDLDNFKAINDCYGYYYGNEVLYSFAQYLKNTLPENHILYRHSNDHFVVLLKGIDCARGRDIAIKICDDCKNGIIIEEINLSCSIGIVGTHISNDLTELLKCADCALVNIKNAGKGFAANYFFTPDDVKTIIHQKHLGRTPDEKVFSDDNIVAFAFEFLQKAKNLQQGLYLLFKQIVRKLNLKDVFILDIDQDSLEAEITHYYYKQEVKNFIVDEHDFQLFKAGFNHDQIYQEKPYIITSRLSELISSASLIISLYEHQNHFGVIFYSQETQQNEDKLRLLSNIISIYLIREINKQEIAQRAEIIMKMSHEIRSPLNGIKGMIRIAQGEIDNKDKLKNTLEKISLSTRYLLSLINNLLDLSRIQKGKMRISNEPFNLNTFINDLDVLMRIQAEEKNIHFKVVKKFSYETIIGDSLRLNQVLINIIGNAIKFTPENGHVTFSIKEVGSTDEKINIKFSVKDDGIGINQENIHRIFTPFEQESSQTVKNYGGTGLGLAISKSLVKMMGGNIEAISEVNRGSEFFFTLTFPKAEQINLENWHLAFSDKRILVAEDNGLNLKIITSFLDEFGCTYDTCTNGQEAVDKFVNNEPYYYDLILMDIRMPVVDGMKATQMIRSSGKDDALLIPIIAMTANAFPEEEQKSIKSGMNAHLIKPIDIQLLYKELSLFLK